MGIYTGIKEDENPSRALGYIKNELPNYWDKRDMIKQLLSFLKDTKDIDVLCIVSLGEQFTDSTVNLKSPLLFSPEHNLGMQSILDQDLPLKAKLA